MMAEESEPGQPMTLARLLLHVKGDLEYDEFARLMPVNPATNLPSPGSKRLEQMIKRPLKEFPSKATIKNLAIGTGLPEQTILDACAVSIGLTIHRRRSRLEVLLPAGVDLLTEGEVEAFISLLRHQVAARRDRGAPVGQPRQPRPRTPRQPRNGEAPTP